MGSSGMSEGAAGSSSQTDAPSIMISVVIPLYNKERFIDRCLASVLSQTYRGFEIVVVDDGSVDGSQARAKELMREQDRLISQTNAGPGMARNRGVRESRGRYIAFLDADDEWTPEFLETMVGLLERYPDARMATCCCALIGHGGPETIVLSGYQEGILDIGTLFRLWLAPYAVTGQTGTMLIDRETFLATGGFGRARYREDHDLFARLALEGPVAFTPTVLLRYHRTEGSICTSSAVADPPPFIPTGREWIAARETPSEVRTALKWFCRQQLSGQAAALFSAGRYDEARKACRAALEFASGRSYAKLWCRAFLPSWSYGMFRRLRSRASH